MRYHRVFSVSVVGCGLAVALLCALGALPEAARAATLCVRPSGSGCYTSIQAAVDAAGDGDTIRVAEGIYYETVEIAKSVTLEGGWNADFSARDWDLFPTTVDAQRTGPTIWVQAPVSPTIEGFIITGGDDTAGLGWGGGIKIYAPGVIAPAGHTTIRHNVITDNVACTAGCQGHGGGIFVYRTTAAIEYNTIISNAARTAGDGGGQGGGVRVWTADATLLGNTIVSNTAVFSPTGLWTGKGGGVGTEHANDVVLIENVVQGNVATVEGPGYGGGVWAYAYMYGNHILSNTASVNGDGYGGGIYAYYLIELDDNLVQGNVASENGDGSGGGVYAIYLKSAVGNAIQGNSAGRGGGVYYKEYLGQLVFHDNTVSCNEATGSGTHDGGGGIASAADWIEMTGNEFYSNTAAGLGLGGGLLISAGERFIVRDNLFVENSAGVGGGIAISTATGTVVRNTVVGNSAVYGGGMSLLGRASPELDGNVVMSNTAAGYLGETAAGGVLVDVEDGVPVTLTNHIVARNATGSGGHGGGVYCFHGDCTLINNTIVDNDLGTYDEGVILGSSYSGTHAMRNNTIVGHSIGVWLRSGTATLDYNDSYDNSISVSGASWGANHVTYDPQFDDRSGGDYHLSLASLLIDEGDSGVDVPLDFEGDPRPRGSGIDIGADEAYRSESYVSQSTGSDMTGDGSSSSPFETVMKGIGETRTAGTVYVAGGLYSELVAITRSVELLGGYSKDDWSRDIAGHQTTIDAEGAGTAVAVHGEGVDATIEGFIVTHGDGSVYDSGGGIAVYDDAAAIIRYNVITDNGALNGAGGVMLWGSELRESVLDSNLICGNEAQGVFALPPLAGDPKAVMQGPESGGGVLLGGGRVLAVNNRIHGNSAGEGGDGMAISAYYGPVRIYHNTIVDNGGEGIRLMGAAAQALLRNNLIVGHGLGIAGATSLAASWDYNGFYDNGADYSPGLAGGGHDLHGPPVFADRAGGDFHIHTVSPMAGRGVDVGIGVDFEGEERPLPVGTRPDIGADELEQDPLRVFLPLVLRNR